MFISLLIIDWNVYGQEVLLVAFFFFLSTVFINCTDLCFIDSWSSGSNSSRDGNVPNTQPHIWIKKELNCEEYGNKSPVINGDVPTVLPKETEKLEVCESPDNVTTLQHAPVAAPNKSSTTTTAPKAKARAAFSESQMNALVQRFSVQRYLTPAEMKNLAEMTGLTYKQVCS